MLNRRFWTSVVVGGLAAGAVYLLDQFGHSAFTQVIASSAAIVAVGAILMRRRSE